MSDPIISNSGNSLFHPSKEVIKKARVKDYDKLYKRSISDREEFWAAEAAELHWYTCY